MSAERFPRPGSPYDATPEELVALWDVADAAKSVMSFMHGFMARGASRKQLAVAVVKLGKALDVLTYHTNEQERDAT